MEGIYTFPRKIILEQNSATIEVILITLPDDILLDPETKE